MKSFPVALNWYVQNDFGTHFSVIQIDLIVIQGSFDNYMDYNKEKGSEQGWATSYFNNWPAEAFLQGWRDHILEKP